MLKKMYCLILIVALSVNMMTVFSEENKLYLYVDINALENGNGTINKPFNSILSAKERVKTIIKNGEYPENGINVILRKGTYKIDDTLTFTSEDSGTDLAPVKWCSYEGEEVVITMGDSIPFSEFDKAENEKIKSGLVGKIYSVNLTKKGIDMYDMLYMGGHSQRFFYNFGMAEEGSVRGGIPVPWIFMGADKGTLARYPNEGEYMITGEKISGGNLDDGAWFTGDYEGHKIEGEIKGFKMAVTDDRISNWVTAENPRVWGVWCHDWSAFDVGLKEIDAENKTIESTHPSPYPLKEGKRWYIHNLLEELDSPGEWFLDKETGELYIYPPENLTENDDITLAFNKKDIINLSNGAKNIEFSGLIFSGTRLNGVSGTNAKNIKFTDLVFEKICSKAITLSGTDIKITGCEFKELGKGGIGLSNSGYSSKLPVSGNVIENNIIHDFGNGYGIEIGGSGAILRNNKIYDAPGSAIGISGNDHLIEKNEMYNLRSETDDAGVIYCVQSMIMRGTVIRENIIHDIYSSVNGAEGVHGIYLDNYQSGYTVTNNLIYNVGGFGVFINMGRDNTVTDNTFINTKRGVHVSAGYLTEQPTDPTDYGITESVVNNEAYQKYPHMDTLLEDDWWHARYNVVKDNYNYNVKKAFFLSPKHITEEEALYENTYEDGYVYKDKERYISWSEFPEFPADGNIEVKKDDEVLTIKPGDKMPIGDYKVKFEKWGKEFNFDFKVISTSDAVFYEDFENYDIGETPEFVTSTGGTMSGEVVDDGTGNKVLKVSYKNEQKYQWLKLDLGRTYDHGKYSYDYKTKIVNVSGGCFSPFMQMYDESGNPIMIRQSIKKGFVYGNGYIVSRENTAMENGYYLSHSILDLDNKKQQVPTASGGFLKRNFEDASGKAIQTPVNFSTIRIRGLLTTDPIDVKAPENSEHYSETEDFYFIDDLAITPLEFSNTGLFRDNERIEKLSDAAGKTVTVRVDVGDIFDEKPEFTVIFALYDGERLKEVKTIDRRSIEIHHAEAEFDLPEESSSYKLSYMIFENLSGLKPILTRKVEM